MPLKERLLEFYLPLEQRYYSICDSLEKSGVKVYEFFITPLESRGVPSFPVAAVIVFLLLASILILLFSSASSASGQGVYVKVTSAGSQPIAGATVELLAVDNSVVFSAVTNSTGEVFFSDRKNALRFNVTAEGYNSLLRPIISRVVVQLQPRTVAVTRQPSRPALNFTRIVEEPQFGSFVIRLRANNIPVDGLVSAIDAATDTVIQQHSSTRGAALFENLPLNQRVYFTATAAGFVYNATPVEFVVNRNRQQAVLEMQRATFVPVVITIISNSSLSGASSSSNAPIAGALVRLYDENNAPVGDAATDVDGKTQFDLPLGKMYYFNARKSGYVTGVSEKFAPSASSGQQRLSLLAVAEDNRNSATLYVNIRDEYNDTFSAAAALYTSDGRIMEQSSFARSRHEFAFLSRGSTLMAVASKGDRTANASVVLASAVNSIILNLDARFAFLDIQAKDIFTGLPVAASAEVKRNGELLDTCAAVPCRLNVKTRGIHQLKVSAAGYFDYEFTYGASRDQVTFIDNSTTFVNATMMPLASVENSAIRFDGVYDAITLERISEGSGSLKQNRLYVASLSSFYANATLAGLYFSPSDSAPSSVEILRFRPVADAVDSPLGLDVYGSTSTDTSSCGTSLPANNIRRLLFNFPLSREERVSQPYLFYFAAEPSRGEALSPSDSSSNSFVVKYKSFIRQSDGSFIRNPFDAGLGVGRGESNGPRSECAAKSFNSTYKLVSTNVEQNDFATLSLYLSQQRQVGTITTSDYPEQCGEAAFDPARENPYEFVDCNGFNVDAGLQPLSLHFSLRLANPTRAGIIRFTSNPVYFSVDNASFTTPGRRPLYLAHRESAIFEMDVTPLLASRDGRTQLDGVINLSATGSTAASEIQVEFIERRDDGAQSGNISKIVGVRLNEITVEGGVNLLAGYSCGSGNVKFSYDEGLLGTGSGWSGCNEIPLVVDSIFPADAVPIFIENTTEVGDCTLQREGGAVWGVENGGITPQVDNTDCFTLEGGGDGRDVEKYGLDVPAGFKPYVLKFNALRPQCNAVHGNIVEARNTTLRFACGGRRTTHNGVSHPYDDKVVNVTVINVSGESTKGLDIHPLLDYFSNREFSISGGAVYFYPVPTTPQLPANPLSNCSLGSTLVRAYQDAEYPTIFRDILEYVPNTFGTYNCDLKNSTGNCIGFGLYQEIAKVGKFSFNRDLSLLRVSPSPAGRNLTVAPGTKQSALFSRQINANYTADLWAAGGFIAYDYCAVSTIEADAPHRAPPFGNNYAFAVAAPVNYSSQLDPQLWVLVSNLQKLGPSEPRESLTFTGAASPISLTDTGNAVALAVDSRYVGRFPDRTTPKLDLAENNIPLGQDAFSPADELFSKIYRSNARGETYVGKPVLSYVAEAQNVLSSTALRRSRGTFYCLPGAVNPADPAQCRPTVGDWLVTTAANDFRAESCQVCSPSTCDAQCNPDTHTYPDGRFCGNYCAAPQCYAADQCVDGVRRVAIPGRTVTHWENSTQLVEQILSAPDNGAPLKYFKDELQGMFNYTVVVNLGYKCTDTQGDVEAGSGNCFAPSSIRRDLPDFDPTNENQLSRLKVKEYQGGCEYSNKWNRGYYKATFSYVYDEEQGKWKWRYYAEPLEVSSTYLQTGDDKCASPTLQSDRRSQLCYYVFSTSASPVGKCVRSLRDYLPPVFDPAQKDANGILLSEVTNFDSKFYSIDIDHTPETLDPVVYRYVRNLDLYSSNALKCDRFNVNPFLPAGKTPIILTKDYPAVPAAFANDYVRVRGLIGTNALPYSFGVDKRGNLDYFKSTATGTCSRVFSGYRIRSSSNVDVAYGVFDSSGGQLRDNTCFVTCSICHGDACVRGLTGGSSIDWWPFWD